QCSAQTVHSGKGVFRWNSTAHGRAQLIECPFGSSFPESATGYAKRRCYLLSNGSVSWGRMDLTSCREEGFKNAEDLTGELWMLTEDPRHLNIERLQEATKQIEGVIEYAIYDKKIAHNMLSIVSNMLAINESLLRFGDSNGTTTTRVTNLVDRFASDVKLELGESITLETENLVVRAVSWDPSSSDEDDPSSLSFAVHYQARQRREQGGGRNKPIPPSQSFWDERDAAADTSFYNDAELTIPLEAVLQAQNQTYQELRIKFVAYRNDKFFREKPTAKWRQCYDGSGYSRRYNCLHTEQSSFQGRRVLQASILNATVTNLTDPVVYILPSRLNVKVFCAYWKENERVWSTDGLVTNQTGNSTACMSTHLTSFSLLLDPTPYAGISEDHLFPLSLISYIGCGLSMLGLILTIITYSLFRCLNRDHPGKILLHLCTSMLLMNAVFVIGSQRGASLGGVDVCVGVAILVHYFLLTTLAWMCVEAINMYQLLIHVFATSESHFMLKRAILAWGLPLIIVGVTVLMDYDVYYNQNEYCMMSASNPYVYYLSFVVPSCVILFVNLTVFLMVTRVLFAPRSNNIQAKKSPQCTSKRDKFLVTTAQVRGAFAVMVLLGVSWVFGAFAVGEARLVFQYIFCVSNSLQGFLIFLVRCLQYSEARSAWYQLLKTGTLKKYRGMVPPGSWSSNSNSGNNKQNGHSTTTRLGSADLTQGPFSTNAFWSKEKASLDIKDVKEDMGYDHDNVTIPSDVVLDYATIKRGSGQLLTFSGNTLKKEDKAGKMSKNKSVSRSNSESSQDPKTDIPASDAGSSHCTFGLNPSVVFESQDSDNEDKNSYREAVSNELQNMSIPKNTELGALPNEPKSKGTYSSSTAAYIDEKRDKLSTSTLDRKNYASKASTVIGNIKLDSASDKQNSWPRTLSSFMSGKEPQAKFTVADMNATNQRHLGECPDRHSFQIIPLQVRPSTPSGLSTFNPGGLHSPFSDTASLPDRSRQGHIHKPHHHSTPDRYSRTQPVVQLNNRSWQSPTGDNVIIDEECQVIVSGPQMRFSPGSSLRTDVPPDSGIFQIWEEQGLASPNEALFSDSAASRL
ncbi:hypothetical protein JTE90_001240, partial [Oedothorax gibbosus]